MSYCPKCNREYDDALEECPYCADSNNNEEESSGKKPISKGTLTAIIAAVIVIAAAIVISVVLLTGNQDSASKNAVEKLTMPSGYEDIISNIKDSDGNVITQATDPSGNEINREVDDDGNVTTTFIGPNGETSTVTTDQNGNILSYDIPGYGSASVSDTPSSGGDENNSGGEPSNNNSSSKASDTSSSNTSTGGNGASSVSSSKPSSSGGDASSSNNNSDNSSGSGSDASSDNGTITINGKQHKPGDTVVLKATVSGINEPVAGYSFKVTYDENVLEPDKSSMVTHDPSCLVNVKNNGEILMNSISAMTGFDFSSPTNAFECKFKIKDTNIKTSDIDFTALEVIKGTGSNELVDVTEDAEISFTVE